MAKSQNQEAGARATEKTKLKLARETETEPHSTIATQTGETNQVIVKLDHLKTHEKPKLPDVLLPGDNRPISQFAREIGEHMAKSGLFQKDDAAVRIKNGKIEPVSPTWFSTHVENYVTTVADKGGSKAVRTMSIKDAKATLACDHFRRHLPTLERFNPICGPVLTQKGTLRLLQPGYDMETKTYSLQGVDYTDSMSASEAVSFLKECLKGFPFADDGRSLAVAIAAMLTVYGSGLLPEKTVIPAFLIQGNRPGLGKGLLAHYAITPTLGSSPLGTAPKSEDEIRKQLLAAARSGARVVFFDNLSGHLKSPAIEAFLTGSVITGRILGTSTAVSVRRDAVVFMTGNDSTLSKDMERRTLTCDLFSDQPSTERKLEEYIDENVILEQRPKILAALWALIREWNSKNQPAASQIHPSFPVWSKIIGGIVESAGFKCPCTPITKAAQPDDDSVDMSALTAAMFESRQNRAFTFKDIITIAREKELFATRIGNQGAGCSKTERTSMGRFLSSMHGTRHGNRLIFMVTGLGHKRRFSVRQAESATDTDLKAA